MKVILLQDVPNLGKKLDVKNVSDGHALNMLIPRNLAKTATPSALKQLEVEKAQIAAERKVQEDLLLKNIKDLEGVSLVISEKANDKGHLFAGVHKLEIAKQIKEQTHLDVIPDCIELQEPIKQIGEYDITVAVQDKKATFKLKVQAK
jgi:large subunit ribosomal protein L9